MDLILFTRLLGLSLAWRHVLNWVIFSTKEFAEEFVLRSHRASPLINPFLTPGAGGRKRSDCTGKFLSNKMFAGIKDYLLV